MEDVTDDGEEVGLWGEGDVGVTGGGACGIAIEGCGGEEGIGAGGGGGVVVGEEVVCDGVAGEADGVGLGVGAVHHDGGDGGGYFRGGGDAVGVLEDLALLVDGVGGLEVFFLVVFFVVGGEAVIGEGVPTVAEGELVNVGGGVFDGVGEGGAAGYELELYGGGGEGGDEGVAVEVEGWTDELHGIVAAEVGLEGLGGMVEGAKDGEVLGTALEGKGDFEGVVALVFKVGVDAGEADGGGEGEMGGAGVDEEGEHRGKVLSVKY